MTWLVAGPLVTADGANLARSTSRTSPTEAWAIPGTEVRSVQPAEIPIRPGHGYEPIGRILRLQRQKGGSVWCLGEIDQDDLALERGVDYYLSVEARYRDSATDKAVMVTGAAICEKTRMIGLQPSAFVRSGLDHHGHAAWRLPSRYRDLLKQYDKARRQRWSSDPIIVQNAPGATTATAATFTRSRVETRSAPVTDVEPSRRQITLLVAPAEVPSLVTERHRTFWETFSHGCFRGAEADPAKIRLNRDHANERVIGAATTIDPWSELGCVGVFRVSRTPLGDETLALAEDGVLSASAAFKVAAGGDEWPDQSHRRIKRGALIHTALTPEPAHEGAVVLDVRGLELAGAR